MKKVIHCLRHNGILFLVIAFSFAFIVILYDWGKEDGCYAACTYMQSDQCHLYCDNHGWR